MTMPGLLLAVDGGNSKTDVAVLTVDGSVLSVVRGPTTAPVHVGLLGSMDGLEALIAKARAAAGIAPTDPPFVAGVFALAGADLPHEEAELAQAVRGRGWAHAVSVRNDVFAVLRAGTDAGPGVAIVCGAGINGVGVDRRGREVRFPALGPISGDWGGGFDVGMAALGAAVRCVDGRGPDTTLAVAVPAYFHRSDPIDLMTAVHLGELAEDRMTELPPTVFAAAAAGDAVATVIVLRLADEVVAIATATLRSLGEPDDVPVVLGGGLLRAGLPLLDGAIRRGIEDSSWRAHVAHPSVVPVLGAGLLALDLVGAEPEAATAVRTWGASQDAIGDRRG